MILDIRCWIRDEIKSRWSNILHIDEVCFLIIKIEQ